MTIIKNGMLVLEEGVVKGDLAFEEGKITRAGGQIPAGEGDEVFDAEGCFIYPGFIDQHTHLQMDTGSAWTADDFESGTRAAACGGTTTIVDFATQDRGDMMMHALEIWKGRAEGVSRCNYAFHMAITDWNEQTKKELEKIRAEGVCSFKIYMAYDNLRVSDSEALEILESMKQIGGLCGCHCENGPLITTLQQREIDAGNTGPAGHPVSRPAQAEAEAIDRYTWLACLADVPVYIVHLSSKLGLEEVRKVRERGQIVYAETCPQYLIMDDEKYLLPGFEGAKYVMSPPLRGKEDVKALREAVLAGEIDAIATDHCSFNYGSQKILGKDDFRKIPNGAPGIEHRPSLVISLLQDKLDPTALCRLLSAGPAKLMGMYPRKGSLKPGSDADVVIWDPSVNWTIEACHQQQNVDYTPYEGTKISGRARDVFVNGVRAAHLGEPVGAPAGEYVKR